MKVPKRLTALGVSVSIAGIALAGVSPDLAAAGCRYTVAMTEGR